MASPGELWRWLVGARRMCVLAAVVASVAGCVGMPSNGPAGEFNASPQSSAPGVNLIGSVPLGPQPGENPSQIVQGFLIAGASYPTYNAAQLYLTSSAVKGWKPGFAVNVYSNLTVPEPDSTSTAARSASPRASIDVTGTVQASFNGSGQYVSVLNPGPASASYKFTLVKVDGQWRITDPPSYRMLPTEDFPLFYKAQDLYFFDPQDEVLVPDSVFVPLGATVSQLLTDLVNSLTAGPKTPWLTGATDTELPPGTSVQQQVTNDGSTVTVNLIFGKTVQPSPRQLELFAAQLVWTLTVTGSPAIPSAIQSVVLDLNGKPWTPPAAPCPGGRSPGLDQTQAAYQCFDPYPSSQASFYYVNGGQSWARCGSEALGLSGRIGRVAPLVGRTGVFASQRCVPGDGVGEEYAGLPPAQPASLPAVTMTAVSPDGKYLAVVTAGKGDLYVGRLPGRAASFGNQAQLTGGDITALTWDRNDRLWVVQGGTIYMLPSTGKAPVQVTFNGSVTDLAVAPDGVRIAFIAQPDGSSSPGLYLAAVGGGQQSSTGRPGSPTSQVSIRAFTSVGPGLTHPGSVAWYDADDLIVVNDVATGNTLAEVPIDGQQPQDLQVAPPNLTSITAAGAANVLVAGLSDGNLAVSPGLEGPWNQLGEPGQHPAYPG